MRTIRRPVVIAGISAAILLLAIFACWQSTKSAPQWYSTALQLSEETNRTNGRLLERRLVDLSNQIRLDESWAAVFPDQMMNGWLASDLPEKLPEALPASVQNPRLRINEESLHLVFQSNSLVVQMRLSVQAAKGPNQIAFKIQSVRTGWLPIPISWWADTLTESLQRKDILLEWSEHEGYPVALLTLPHSVTTSDDHRSILETIQLQGNEIAISGINQWIGGEANPASVQSNLPERSTSLPSSDRR